MDMFNIAMLPLHIFALTLNVRILLGFSESYSKGLPVLLICMILLGVMSSIRSIYNVLKPKLPAFKAWYANITIKESGD